MKDDRARGLFHGFPEELKITAVMCAMELAPATRELNNAALAQRQTKKDKEDLIKKEGLEKVRKQITVYTLLLYFCLNAFLIYVCTNIGK